MTRKIFRSILVVASSVLLVSLLVVTVVLYSQFVNTESDRLGSELTLAVRGVEMNGEDYLNGLASNDYRITWVGADGTVLYDTEAAASEMDDHSGREEIAKALKTGFGESQRYSDTLTKTMLYNARRLSDGTVLRLAVGVDSIFALLLDILIPMLVIFVIAAIVSMIVARSMAKRIVDPINRLDLEQPENNEAYDELSPLLGRIERQHRQITEQMNMLRQRADEFAQITESMSEGLVLLDQSGMVLSINSAAKKIFRIESSLDHENFLSVDRSVGMNHAVNNALEGNKGEIRAEHNGSEYHFIVNPIRSDERIIGVVILGFDISDRVFAERNRQEFTANVSHELKTPLQSIIGYTELLQNDLAAPEDRPRFVSMIRREAGRLVNLINDIIHLSQLDENVVQLNESIDVVEVAKEAADALKAFADARGVFISVDGTSSIVEGVRQYIYEILYNLCDNAIRYNKPGGAVNISIRQQCDGTEITVSDTGIGIAPEHHARIFERFYRVDKSHSKASGGTGLGLSIVKHAVQYHGGKISIESTLGHGTTMKVQL